MKNKILTALLSLAISFGLWLYVVTVISPESEQTFYGISVELVGTSSLDERDLIIISDTKNLQMDLTLRGNRSDLNKLNQSNIVISADVSGIKQAGEHEISCRISFQSGTADVISQEPETIKVVVAEQIQKTVPVKVETIGSPASGFEADMDNILLEYTEITVKGPKDIVEQVGSAVAFLDLTSKTESVSQTYALTLYGQNNQQLTSTQFVSVNRSDVHISLQIYRFRKVKLNFRFDYTDTDLEGKVTPKDIYCNLTELTLIGSKDGLEMAKDEYTITIALSKYLNNMQGIVLSVPDLPEGVRCKEEIRVDINNVASGENT